ncbi:hypothetical protein KY591_000945 [Escherichia coli]|nr:hypothetical protein [Escherichia coli]
MIKKRGDSPAVRVPAAVMKDAALHVGDVVNVIAESGAPSTRRWRPRIHWWNSRTASRRGAFMSVLTLVLRWVMHCCNSVAVCS